MNCAEVEELAGTFALGALKEGESVQLEAHLASCDRHPEMSELRETAASLAWAAEAREPPAHLKTRLMAAIRQESGPTPVSAKQQTSWWVRLWAGRRAPALAAALAVAVVGLLAWNIYLQTTDGDSGASTALVRDLRAGGHASGKVVYATEQRVGVITVSGLEPLPPSQTYQVWAMDGGATGLALLEAQPSGEAIAAFALKRSAVDRFAVTIEPAGGSSQPTTTPVLETDR